ncbi:uncharacterized protein O3C94_015284 [Discoglossus pictus]
MNKTKNMMTKRILSHVLEVISLLTGEVSLLKHLSKSLMMNEINKDKKMAGKILNHTLEIIYLLTGEEYTIVKKDYPHSNIHYKTGECRDAAVSLSMEVWDQTEALNEEEIEDPQTANTLEIPSPKSQGLQDESIDTVSEEGEDEVDEKDILQVTIHPDLCARVSNMKPSMVEKEDQQQVKEEEIPVYINEDGSLEKLTSGRHNGANTSLHCRIGVNGLTNLYEEATHVDTVSKNGSLEVTNIDKQITCPDCGKCFTKKAYLINHQRVHTGERPFICSDCGKSFTQQTNLIAHKRVHTGEKPFVCSECGKCFSQKANLVTHKRVHKGEKSFMCSECGKCFAEKSKLNIHLRVHTGEKPFECFDCGKCFSQNSVLIDHRRIHTGEKPFICFECGKCFSKKSNLISHRRVHTGEKPFSCPECGKCYADKSNLNIHMRSHKIE